MKSPPTTISWPPASPPSPLTAEELARAEGLPQALHPAHAYWDAIEPLANSMRQLDLRAVPLLPALKALLGPRRAGPPDQSL